MAILKLPDPKKTRFILCLISVRPLPWPNCWVPHPVRGLQQMERRLETSRIEGVRKGTGRGANIFLATNNGRVATYTEIMPVMHNWNASGLILQLVDKLKKPRLRPSMHTWVQRMVTHGY